MVFPAYAGNRQIRFAAYDPHPYFDYTDEKPDIQPIMIVFNSSVFLPVQRVRVK